MTDAVPPLEVMGAHKAYGSTEAVVDVGFTLARGELLTLVGPSGCGKSTLLRLVAGLERLDAGRLSIGGQVADDGRRATAPEHRPVGLVFQDHALFPHLTVAANVGFGVRRNDGRRRTTDELLELFGLGHLGGRYPHEVSGGERQRVSLARAMAPGPELLLLDEPFASLDPIRRAQVRVDVVDRLRAAGTTAILVTHDQTEALAVGDRVAVLDHGRLQQLDTPVAVYETPANRFVAGFMGEARFLPVRPVDGRLATVLGPVTGPASAGDLAVVRPTDVALAPAIDGPAVVHRAEFRGGTWCYEVHLPDGTSLLSAHPRREPLATGTRVEVSLAADHHLAVVSDAT